LVRVLIAGGVAGGIVGAGCVLAVRGALTVDLGVGRRTTELGPLRATIDAAPDAVFDVIAGPYLGRTPRAMASKLRVLEQGSDMVVAAHFTPIGALTATTIESVRFERPHRISFRLLRGPVPYVTEAFALVDAGGRTEFTYTGELGTDFWRMGQWWGHTVAARWERAVQQSITSIKAEAERRHIPSRASGSG
jgi:hypothetical protein